MTTSRTSSSRTRGSHSGERPQEHAPRKIPAVDIQHRRPAAIRDDLLALGRLGLAIARQLTLAMDGDLSLHNRDGGGLEARLTLKGPPAV
jgi:signal transduction histidine kinase